MNNFFKDKSVLITGGTGSFGQMFTKIMLDNYDLKKIVIYSRDEMKQWNMRNKFNDDRIQFCIGDVRDKDRLTYAMADIDYAVHAAATKIVPTAEYNPFECVQTNINGAMNLIQAAISNNVSKVVALSTDKASNPINLYGATKLASDKIFIAGNNLNYDNRTTFSIVRYGNVMGSRGSVIPYFMDLIRQNKSITITDERMTRFMITLEQGVELVLNAFLDMVGGEIYVKKIPSMNIVDIAKAISKNANIEYIGIRPGEKIHEQMIGSEDSEYTYEYNNYYKILPMINDWYKDKKRIKEGKKVKKDFIYSSNLNSEWMSSEFLSEWITLNMESFIKI